MNPFKTVREYENAHMSSFSTAEKNPCGCNTKIRTTTPIKTTNGGIK